MVGVFSRFSVSNGHRRSQSAIDERDKLPPCPEATTDSTAVALAADGIEIAVQFKPVECPTEPLDNDQPIQCPLPEPSILNDGRIWKERVSLVVEKRDDALPVQEESPVKAETPRTSKRRPPQGILPSISAPEHDILKLLEECNESSISFNKYI